MHICFCELNYTQTMNILWAQCYSYVSNWNCFYFCLIIPINKPCYTFPFLLTWKKVNFLVSLIRVYGCGALVHVCLCVYLCVCVCVCVCPDVVLEGTSLKRGNLWNVNSEKMGKLTKKKSVAGDWVYNLISINQFLHFPRDYT